MLRWNTVCQQQRENQSITQTHCAIACPYPARLTIAQLCPTNDDWVPAGRPCTSPTKPEELCLHYQKARHARRGSYTTEREQAAAFGCREREWLSTWYDRDCLPAKFHDTEARILLEPFSFCGISIQYRTCSNYARKSSPHATWAEEGRENHVNSYGYEPLAEYVSLSAVPCKDRA